MKVSKKEISIPIENPFEKVTAEQLNHDLIAYLFAKPEEAVYNKLINRENYRIIGGWGSGKTTLLKYISFDTQLETLGEGIKTADFIGIYIKIGQSGFKPFLKPGGVFKEGGENLFGHYFNLIVLERILSIILEGYSKGVFSISPEKNVELANLILAKFATISKGYKIGFKSPINNSSTNLQKVRDKVKIWRYEIETFLNTRDLEKDLSYKNILSVYPTNIYTFINEVIQDVQRSINDFSKKRFYILLDECDSLSLGQQKVINTIIKQRFTTIVFKLSSRPPDIKTMETIDEGAGLTDREIQKLHLDKMYDPTSMSYRDLCFRVAEKRLEKYGYPNKDIRNILGEHTLEDEVGKNNIETHLKENYPNKNRVRNKFNEVYKDFKGAAAFQILRQKKSGKKYAGFKTFVMLSSGIMLHFLELCRDSFIFSQKKYIIFDENENVHFKKIPLPIEVQDKAAQKVSKDFLENIESRAESLKDTQIDMEFGGKIQYIISVLGGLFRDKLMTFNEPEAARIEIPEGKSTLDNNLDNPIQQIFETAIAISVFQESDPYMPKHIGETKPPTYILNRILAPFFKISPSPRWRTKIPIETFNKILVINDNEFKREILKKGKTKKDRFVNTKSVPKKQISLPFPDISENMPILSYLSSNINNQPFKGKTLLILLHFLKDLVPFIEVCKKLGALPSKTIIFYKNYKYPNKEEIEDYLKKEDYSIYSIKEIDCALKKITIEKVKNIIIIEDGGIIVPALYEKFNGLYLKILGAVEQTTKGIRNYSKIPSFSFPIISIPGSELKDTFEPPHVARAVISNIQIILPDKNLSGKSVLVIGYGNIGEQIALQLRDTLKMSVSVFDSDYTKLIKAKQNGLDIYEELLTGLKEKSLIIGATGETIIGKNELLAMGHNVYLISASSEQWEFCISELNALSSKKNDLIYNTKKIGTNFKIRNTEKHVNLLADGYPINFWESESMPNEVSDLIMSLIFISVVEIAINDSIKSGIDYEIVNQLEKKYELSKLYLAYHK